MKNHPPLVSIIIPNYNNARYIRGCLASVLNQTYKNIEVIVADDCSSDDSRAIIQDFENNTDGTVRGIYHPKNNGVAFNRHSAIIEATGGYITTLDSDDYYYDRKKLENEMGVVLFYRNNLKKDVCAFSNVVLVNEEGDVVAKCATAANLKEGMILEDIISRSCFIPRDFIFTRAAYDEAGGFNTALTLYEDWDLKIRIAAKYPFYYSGGDGTGYRRHGRGLSAAPLIEHIENTQKIFYDRINLVPESNRHEVAEKFFIFQQNMRARLKLQ